MRRERPLTPGPRRTTAYRLVCGAIDAALHLVSRRDVGPARLPAGGPLLVAPNHVSVLDPLVVACAVLRRGRVPRFVTTAEVFDLPVVGPVLRFFDHLPLDRTARGDLRRLAPIEAALRRGECVVLYPEGGLTTDPDLRPGRGRPGIALLAAATGAPVVPVGHWGTHSLWRGGRSDLLRRRPRRPRVRVLFGSPRELPPDLDLRGAVAATRELMAAVTALADRARADLDPPGAREVPETPAARNAVEPARARS